MRTAFLVLVLANLGFFAWSRYLSPDASADALPLSRQIEPAKLKVVQPPTRRRPRRPSLRS
jgi:hypothetical protein